MKNFRGGKKIWMIIPIVIAAILLFGLAVMGLWNAILPDVLGVKALTYGQALGILLLSKLLFGGFGKGGGPGRQWKNNMREKWQMMTPEEREKFKAEWKNRCGHSRWGMRRDETAAD